MEMSKERQVEWRCLNYGACGLADEKTPVSLTAGVPFRCPGCGEEEGVQIRAKAAFPLKPLVMGFSAVALLAVIVSLLKPSGEATPPPPPRGLTGTPPPPLLPVSGAILDERTGLPKQVLARPKSELRLSPDDGTEPATGDSGSQKKIRDFQRLFVFENRNGWMKVGADTSNGTGWLRESDTVDWPHSLVLEYTSPDNRQPVLFFKDKEGVVGISEDLAAHQDEIGSYYRRIHEIADSGTPLGEEFPVLCVEPRDKIDDFYLLPVLEAQMLELEGYPARILKVTAAGRERGATTLADREYVRKAVPQAAAAPSPVPLDVVFVMDMTGTMQPWVDGVSRVMFEVAKQLGSSNSEGDLIRMGFWGYQDDPGLTGIQFRTKNFIPDLVAPQGFTEALHDLQVNELTSDSYPEDVFSGVLDAVAQTRWRPKTTRIVILIGDAPGHTSPIQGGATGMDAPQVRQRASDAGVKIVSVQIRDSSKESYVKWHEQATEQFQKLAVNDNRAPAFIAVDSHDSIVFERDLGQIIRELTTQTSLRSPGVSGEKGRGTQIAEGLLAAARVDQVSAVKNDRGEIEVPRDFTGWTLDRDLLDPAIVSLEPKLMVSKNELSTLQQTVSDILRQAREGSIVGGSFFDRVVNTVAQTASGQEMNTLAGTVPQFIKGLPYKSDLMEKTAAWWNARTAEQQQEFIRALEAKLSYYRVLNEDASKWRALNAGDEPGLHVTALPLSQLP